MTNRTWRAAMVAGAAVAALAGSSTFGAAQQIAPANATPTPVACARPNLPASVIRAAQPVTPPAAEQQGIAGTVDVVVSLDADSRVVATRIMHSPNAELNQAAMAATRATTFQTEIRACRPIAADYIYSVAFESDITLATTASGERVVSVTAQGTALRAPDAAYVVARIMTEAADPGTATVKNDAVVAALEAKLRPLGIDGTKIQTTAYREVQATQTSRLATRSVDITVPTVASGRDVATAAASVDAVTVMGIRYALNDRGPAYRDALGAAVEDGERRARLAANGLHLRLGALKQVFAQPLDARAAPPVAFVSLYHPAIPLGSERANEIPQLIVRASAIVTYALVPEQSAAPSSPRTSTRRVRHGNL